MIVLASSLGWSVATPLVFGALVPSGSEVIVNTFTDSTQFAPDVVAATDGKFLVVWSGKPSLFETFTSIHGQWVASDGAKIGPEFLVNRTAEGDTSNEQYPRASAAGGGFVVVWENNRGDDGSEFGVLGQRLDAEGRRIGSEFVVNAYTSGEQLSPSVAGQDDGRFVVAWRDAGSFGELRHDLKVRWFGASGEPETGDVRVIESEEGQPILNDVEVSQGQTMLAWQALGVDGHGDGVVTKRYDAAHDPSGELVLLNSQATLGNQGSVDLVVAPDEGIIAVWQSHDGENINVVAQRFDDDFRPLGAVFRVNSYTTGSQANPRVAASGDGSFVVIWSSEEQDGDGAGVFGQLYSPQGERQGGEFRVNVYTSGDQGNSRIDLSLDISVRGDILVAWESDGQDGSSTAIAARPFCIAGHRFRPCGDVTCSDGPSSITAADALVALRAAISTQRCALCVCDADGSGAITATDALAILRLAVGYDGALLECPACS